MSGDTLDLRGETCPYTFVRAKLRLEKLRPGDELTIVVDSPTASVNVPRSITEWGQEVTAVEPELNTWKIKVLKRTDETSG